MGGVPRASRWRVRHCCSGRRQRVQPWLNLGRAGISSSTTRWLRRNLFRGPIDSVVTVVVGGLLAFLLYRILRFVLVTGRWEIVEVNLKLLMVGRYPDVHLPRVGISIVIAATVGGLLAGVVHRRQVDAGTATPRRPATGPTTAPT